MRSRKSSAPEQLGLDLPGLPLAATGPARGRRPHLPALLAGVDEAGRGPLAGPVVAAAVILDELRPVRGLADSKQLTARRREALFDQICAQALCVSIAQASVAEIDQLNILQATMLAMRRAVLGLRLRPLQVWVDGNRVPSLVDEAAVVQGAVATPAQAPMTVRAIVQGDALVPAISAASILAKVTRDRLCADLHASHPQYGFDGHKGYPTAAHLAALRLHGPCAAHRRSFAPVRALLEPLASP